MNKFGLQILPCSPILTSRPVNPGRKVDRSTGEQVWNTLVERLTTTYQVLELSILVNRLTR